MDWIATILWWIIGVLLLNCLIGAGVWAAIDEEDGRFYKWYCDAPRGWIKPLVLLAWPFALWVWHRETHMDVSDSRAALTEAKKRGTTPLSDIKKKLGL
ncbi:MAG: hypothetical protein Q7U76_12965 [Nitrospirota bacterium]|nr:hypothetical protein [Nitrospirota bacterium]